MPLVRTVESTPMKASYSFFSHETTYADRFGKYQDQPQAVTSPGFSNLDLEFTTRLSSQDSRAAMPFATSEHRLKVLHRLAVAPYPVNWLCLTQA